MESMTENDVRLPQCLKCEGSLGRGMSNDVELKEVGQLICDSCQSAYVTVGGVPYLGTFNPQYFESLLELSAIGANVFDNKFEQADLENDYREYIRILDAMALGMTDAQICKEFGLESLPGWLPNRLNETLQFQVVAAGLDFKGKSVLDVGAGTGFDSLRFQNEGADVTCLEFNPVQAALGHKKIKCLKWYGGSAYQIPFMDESFDYVVANAALHHLVDIPTALEEMLRVLKVGGTILTFADSFRRDGATELDEARIFNRNAVVMGGVNERVPRISEFISIPLKYKNFLSGYGFPYIYDRNALQYPRRIEIPKLGQLTECAGTLCYRITKEKPIKVSRAVQPDSKVSVDHVVRSLVNEKSFLSEFIETAPPGIFNLGLHSAALPKLQLLNGLQLPEDGEKFRRSLGRARFFFEDDFTGKSIFLKLGFPFRGQMAAGEMRVSINDTLIYQRSVEPGFKYSSVLPIPADFKGRHMAVSVSVSGIENCEMLVYEAKVAGDAASESSEPETGALGLKSFLAGKSRLEVVVPAESPFDEVRNFLKLVVQHQIPMNIYIYGSEIEFYRGFETQIRMVPYLGIRELYSGMKPASRSDVLFLTWKDQDESISLGGHVDDISKYWTVDAKGFVNLREIGAVNEVADDNSGHPAADAEGIAKSGKSRLLLTRIKNRLRAIRRKIEARS